MRWILGALAMLALIGCKDETVTGYGAADRVWILESIDGKAFPARAELRFPGKGKVSGRAPCNQFFADQKAPYPWFELGPIGVTRMACPDLPAENTFFDALEAMMLVEVGGNILILSNDTGREMVFRAAP